MEASGSRGKGREETSCSLASSSPSCCLASSSASCSLTSSSVRRKRKGKFYASYLLVSLSERSSRGKGRTYIGFTVNPSRRIRQHNGKLAMGACSTRAFRPWEMVLVVYGFSSKGKALAFEWAWQHPRRSKAIKEKVGKIKRTALTGMKGKVRILNELLCSEAFASEAPNLRVQVLDSKHSDVLPCLSQTRVPVSIAPMQELPTEDYGQGEEEEEGALPAGGLGKCMLCFGELIEGCAVLACRCRSAFHVNCLEKHLPNPCPMCQYPLTMDEALDLGRGTADEIEIGIPTAQCGTPTAKERIIEKSSPIVISLLSP
ncbi:structure-specific endonuclease [Chloropicon primus]|uniref:Structure-specific endonuclease subunit SLX1 homolog n=1 Tax=Chloropicon primus TaxID=1764295 RepID=A0A5B8MPC8_9CHLO|nr:structure-specific endonuclease [Chloropicon primus]|mmetsp:Transcript_8756/g.24988  ORF Transcript_8756/g.24988 Transcript_8756/m.24988 type:complete len:316 (+) Transcript_8756:189-1136(+)|eukprot:QDZ22181.1 structure-specific endonuclease [Chloropicon primus]